MARILFSAVDPRLVTQLTAFLAADRHEIRRERSNAAVTALLDANVVFAGGEPTYYLPLLRRVRAVDPLLCFVVVARYPDTSEWLEAIEAGATDYWSSPFDPRLIRSLIATSIARRAAAGAAASTRQAFIGESLVRG